MLGVIFAAGDLVLLIFSFADGNGARIGSSILLVASYLAFDRAGIIPGSFQQALDTARKLKG